jgi:uncharacterized protein
MTLFHAVVLFLAAMLAGALNSVAGGGSFISFPALLFTDVGAKIANATNAVALWPGSAASVGAYRRELTEQRGLVPIIIISLIGGVIGALVLLATPEATFGFLLPWLLLFATLLFAFGRNISAKLRTRVLDMNLPSWMLQVLILALQLFVAVYGGFFGGGIGIMMLAVLSLAGLENIHQMNALKTLLATCINGAAVVAFVLAKSIFWPQAIVMIAGAIIGGFGGAYYARKIDPVQVRRFVIGIASIMTVYFFIRTYFLP